jgi:hypothetical protein
MHVIDASHQFRLVVDRPRSEGSGVRRRRPPEARPARGPEVLDVPSDGPSYLVVGPDGAPRVVGGEGAPEDAFLIEPVLAGSQPELLLVSRPDHRARINGQPAPLVALLAERDQVHLPQGVTLHVTTYHQPRIGPPAAGQVGRTCPVCRTAITAKTTVYTCWHCGLPMHLEGADGLDCARVARECLNCTQARVILKPQYTSFPEDLVHD